MNHESREEVINLFDYCSTIASDAKMHYYNKVKDLKY